jgi:hypothetical protein
MKLTLALVLIFLSSTLHAAESSPEMKPLLGERGVAVFNQTFDGPDAQPLDVIPPTIGFGEGAKGVLVDNIKINAFR